MMSQPSPVNQSRTWDISSQKTGSLLSSVLSGRHIFFSFTFSQASVSIFTKLLFKDQENISHINS